MYNWITVTVVFVIQIASHLTNGDIQEVDKSESYCSLRLMTDSFHQLLLSNIKIIQIDVDFQDAESLKPNESYAHEWFKPTRWFMVRGERTNRLLLLFHYYYGFFGPYLAVTMEKRELLVNPTDRCFDDISSVNSMDLIRTELLEMILNPDGILVFEDNQVCSMNIRDENGFGVLIYQCCVKSNGVAVCINVLDDAWVWTLRISILCLSVFIFLYFPKLIPRTHRHRQFSFMPTEPIATKIVKTSCPEKYQQSSDFKISLSTLKQMHNFQDGLKNAQKDVVYTAGISKLDLLIQREQILSETDQAVSFQGLLYDMFIRFKLLNVDSLHDCCHAPVCGNIMSTGSRWWPWYEFLYKLRTLIMYCVVALPAIPLLYSLASDDTKDQELANAVASRNLHQISSFSIGLIAGKVATSVLCSIYILHVVMVLFVNNFKGELIRILESTHQKSSKETADGSGSFLQRVTTPFTKYGLLVLPVMIVILTLSPLFIVMYLVFTAPVFQIMLLQIRGMCSIERNRSSIIGTRCSPGLSALSYVTLLTVFVVLTIGINFLLHLLCILIVNALINLTFSMSVISLVIPLIVYIRDTANSVSSKYNGYHKSLLKQVLLFKQDVVMVEACKTRFDQRAKVFQVKKDDIQDSKTGQISPTSECYNHVKGIWDMKRGHPRMRTFGLVLFLDRHDVPFIPRKFFERMTELDCPGCPGPLHVSIVRALKDLCKICGFLFSLFVLVMAYGETISMTPTSRFFLTVATGLIPLALRSFFFSKDDKLTLDTSTLRFKNNFWHEAVNFSKKWVIKDCQIDEINTHNANNKPFAFSLWKMADNQNVTEDKQEADLIVDLTTTYNESRIACKCCRNGDIREGTV